MWRLVVGALLLGVVATAQAQLGPLGAPSPAPLAFATITVLNMATRNAGTYGFSGQAVQTGIVGAILMMDVSQATDPLPSLEGTLEGSLDGGTTWTPAGSFGPRPAGPKGLIQGQPLTQLGAKFSGGPFWSASSNPNRQLRGTATLGGSMRFALTVTPQ